MKPLKDSIVKFSSCNPLPLRWWIIISNSVDYTIQSTSATFALKARFLAIEFEQMHAVNYKISQTQLFGRVCNSAPRLICHPRWFGDRSASKIPKHHRHRWLIDWLRHFSWLQIHSLYSICVSCQYAIKGSGFTLDILHPQFSYRNNNTHRDKQQPQEKSVTWLAIVFRMEN